MAEGLGDRPFGCVCVRGNAVGEPASEQAVGFGQCLGGPSIFMPETTYDFGEVNEGVEVTHELTVENKGNADLAIIKVSPD